MAAVLDTALLQALLLTGQAAAALDLLKGLNYCDVKICEEILRNGNHYVCLLELYKCNSMHRDALKLLHQLVEESKSDDPKLELTQKFKPKMIIEYLKPLCGIDPMLVLEFSMLVLESCPTQTIDLFLSGANISFRNVVAMSIDPEWNMIQPDIGRIEKWILRNAFDDDAKPYLPKHILYRQKEQFNDGVGYSWIDGLKDHANQQVTNSMLANVAFVYPENTPTTKEAYYYWTIFEKFFPKIHTDSEELLIIKTRESLLNALTNHVKAKHEYNWCAACWC